MDGDKNGPEATLSFNVGAMTHERTLSTSGQQKSEKDPPWDPLHPSKSRRCSEEMEAEEVLLADFGGLVGSSSVRTQIRKFRFRSALVLGSRRSQVCAL